MCGDDGSRECDIRNDCRDDRGYDKRDYSSRAYDRCVARVCFCVVALGGFVWALYWAGVVVAAAAGSMTNATTAEMTGDTAAAGIMTGGLVSSSCVALA
jgi:hypothetical protein